MPKSARWTVSQPLAELRAEDLRSEGRVFRHGDHLYRTTGQHLSHGGMGSVFLMERRSEAEGESEPVVGKVFHAQYLYQLRTDEITGRDHRTTLDAIAHIARIDHPHLLPVYLSEPVADNHLFISPRKADTLLGLVARGALSARRRVRLLMQALRGLSVLHESRLLHRDFTLRNILVDAAGEHAYLFDFDLALHLDGIAGTTYRAHYQGRIFGSPGFSVAPELVAENLMDRAVTPRLDIYAIGGALFRLFSEHTPHGPTTDMWGLLMNIAEGLVFAGHSRIDYPDEVPSPLRPVIDRCLERDPGQRFGSVRLALEELERCLDQLDDSVPTATGGFRKVETMIHSAAPVPDRTGTGRWRAEIRSLPGASQGPCVTPSFTDLLSAALERYGYRIERNLGQVRERPIYLVAPIPELVASGKFPYANTYPKIVTIVNLNLMPDAQQALEQWFGSFLPVLESVRQGQFTSLHKSIYDEFTGYLMLFSEFVADPRFGTDLAEHALTLREAFALAFLVIRQVGHLHEHGMAHNNVRAESLLFKGMPATRTVLPCMVGLVDPALAPEALADDVRNLAALILSWMHPARIEAAEQSLRRQVEALRQRLAGIAFSELATPPAIDELFALVANALSTVDDNFRVLREHRGDLQRYLLLVVSHGLYHLLWPDTRAE
ncbi:serine/threonine-protein kinase [Haliangium sp.]|uniref:serine/threonine protein kinase n=1 Tax=Haliangium sp. TaxID=2663208 RepID=UPI003D097550